MRRLAAGRAGRGLAKRRCDRPVRSEALGRRTALPRLMRVMRAVAGLNWGGLWTCAWTLLALASVRRQLISRPLDAVALPAPPRPGLTGARSVSGVLAHQRANCIERALVRQRWLAGRGTRRDLMIGVSAPGDGFHAHAWLGGGTDLIRAVPADRDKHATTGSRLVEIHRRPTPAHWLATRQTN